jgi:hypothetical protein
VSAAVVSAVVLASSVLLGAARLLWPSRLAASRVRPWRTALLLIGPAVAALFLHLAMFPPPGRTAPGTLTVLTAGVTQAQLTTIGPQDKVVALPEAPAGATPERVADLATALRRDPSVERLIVLGVGLPPRDREAARNSSLEFEAAPLPRGVIELWSPRRVRSGSAWPITGVVHDVPGGTVELLDPSQQRVASASPGDDGRFTLRAAARTPGRAQFRLRVRDASQGVVEDVEVPLSVVAGAPLRVRVLSGAPSPELKYLRRWALDAGVDLQSEILLRPGVRVLRSAAPLKPDALRELDLVILDERAWRSLGAAGRLVLAEALREGLGVVIRITGTLTDRDRKELQELGFTVRDADGPRTASIAGIETALSRRPLRVESRDGVPLLRDSRGEPLALWRAEGQGRVALWWLGDSFRLALDGSPAVYGTLWSDALATVSRARATREPDLPGLDPRVDARQAICGLAADAEASVQSPDGQRVPLLRESSGCAAYWPETAGWHVLDTGAGEWPFHVRAAGEAAGLQAQELRTATAAMVTSRIPRPDAKPPRGTPGSPWPYLLACLVALGGTWWLERSRVGRQPRPLNPEAR